MAALFRSFSPIARETSDKQMYASLQADSDKQVFTNSSSEKRMYSSLQETSDKQVFTNSSEKRVYASRQESSDKKVFTSSTIAVSQDIRAHAELVQEVLRQVDAERHERMIAMEGVLGRLDRQQTLIAQFSETQVGSNVARAAAHEQREMLSAIATIHSEVEALRHMILALQNGRDGMKSKFTAVDSDVAGLYSRLDDHQRRQDELHQLLNTQMTRPREVTVQPAGASVEALQALEAAFARNCEERDRHAESLKARIDEVVLRNGELADGHREVVSRHTDLHGKHTQVADEVTGMRARQEEHARQLVNHKDAFHARMDSTAGTLRQEIASLREEWRAALNVEVRSLRQEVASSKQSLDGVVGEHVGREGTRLEALQQKELASLRDEWRAALNAELQSLRKEVSASKQAHAAVVGDHVEREGKRLEMRLEGLQQKALRDIQIEKSSPSPTSPIDLNAIEVAVSAVKVEVKKLLDAERAMRMQGDADEQEARKKLAVKVEQLGSQEAQLVAHLQDSITKFKAATEYELATLRGWYASLEEECRGLRPISAPVSPSADQSPSRNAELQRQMDNLASNLQNQQAEIQTQQAEITALMQKKQDDMHITLRSQDKLIADTKASAEDNGSKAESALVLVKKLQADLAAQAAKQSKDVVVEASPRDFEAVQRDQVTRIVQDEVDKRMSKSQETVNILFDQTASKASEATQACYDLKLHLNVVIEDLSLAVRKEEDLRAQAVAEVRQLVYISVDEERRERLRQETELKTQLEQEVRDRIVDNTEQRHTMIKAMKEWHRRRMITTVSIDDEDFERLVATHTQASPNSKTSWFGSWGRSS